MRILVTGGAGLVGSHTAEYYAKKGNEVIVLDNLMRSKLFGYDKKSVEYNWNYLAKYKSIKRIKGDVRRKRDVMESIGKGVDVVIHTAGQPGVPLSIRIPEEDFSINAYGTLNVLECVRQKCKDAVFIYCSTNKVYGENVDKIPLVERKSRYMYKGIKGISEILPIDHTGHTPYGVSKYVGDIYTQEYAYIYGMKTAVFRMSCLSKDMIISTAQGNTRIKDIRGKSQEIFCLNDKKIGIQRTKGSFETDSDGKLLYKVKTKSGYQIEATNDHKFYTPGGYLELDKIHYGGFVAVCPELFYMDRRYVFKFPKKIIISEKLFEKNLKKYGRRNKSNFRYLASLKQRGLLPLRYNSPYIYPVARLVGYLTGDAHLYHRIRPNGKSYTEIQVYALRGEIDNIKKDFALIGFKPGKTRVSYSKSILSNGHIIDGNSYKFSITTTDAFAFFESLGVPVGHKSKIEFEIPNWILNGPEDIQDEYLRGLFGAEMSRPHFFQRRGRKSLDLQPLIFTQSKNIELSKNAVRFRHQIKSLLQKRGVQTRVQQTKFLYKKGGDKSISFALLIKPSRENFLKFARIGFEFNNERKKSLYRIIEFLKTGLSYSCYYEWIKEHTYGIEDTNLLWDRVLVKKQIPMKEIYDITVPVHHNFIANGFVVHNCIYGTRQFGFEDQGWVAWFVIANLLNKPITIYGNGKQVRDLLYVTDLIEAYDKFIRSDLQHEVFNIGGGPENTASLLEFIDELKKITKKENHIRFDDWRPSDQKVYISDITKVSKKLNWHPKISPKEGIRKIIEWVKDNKKIFN